MNKKLFFIVVMTAGIVINLLAQDARDIADKALSAIEFESMEMTSKLSIFDNRGNVRERQVIVATKKFGEIVKTLIKFISPADVRGTAMLIHDYKTDADDMWIYLPSLRKTRRIVSTEKGKNFMGSEFTNADMSKPNMDDFVYKLLGSEEVNGKMSWKIETACKDKNITVENGFSKKISYIDKNSYLTYKVEYFDPAGAMHKVMLISNYKKQSNGRHFAFDMEIKNLQNERKSQMVVEKFQLGSKLNEDSFSVSNLDK